MKPVFIDFETYSKYDIKLGAHKYCENMVPLMMSYKTTSSPIVTVESVGIRRVVESILEDKNLRIVAHNVSFEKTVIDHIFGYRTHPNKYLCTASLAVLNGLPRKLEDINRELGLHTKLSEGKKLMKLFCEPNKENKRNLPSDFPREYERFIEYCEQDVRCLEELYNTLITREPLERQIWNTDRLINERGIPIDQRFVLRLKELVDYQNQKDKESFRLITGINPTQREAFKKWLTDKKKIELPNMQEQTLLDLMDSFPPDVQSLLKKYSSANKKAVAKLPLLLDALQEDSRVRDTLIYAGAANTRRWAGSGVQFHNFKRPTFPVEVDKILNTPLPLLELLEGNLIDLAVNSMRATICTQPDKLLISGDYKNIESRLLMYYAGEQETLELYRKGIDLYKEMAATLFNKPYEKVEKKERYIGKQIILGCGFQIGGKKFQITCGNKGLKIDLIFANKCVKAFRTRFKKVVKFWYGLDGAALKTVQSKKTVKYGDFIFSWVNNTDLRIMLPSKRAIIYRKIGIRPGKFGQELYYKESKGTTTNLYGGKIAENIIQALDRDVLAHAMVNLENTKFKHGMKPILNIHDQLICEAYKDRADPVRLKKIMEELPVYLQDAPLEAETSVARRYSCV